MEVKEARVLLLHSWKDFETNFGTPESIQTVRAKIPKKVKRKRKLTVETEDGLVDAGWEEYNDYIFPEDEVAANKQGTLKLLEAARRWKKLRMAGKSEGGGEGETSGGPEEEPGAKMEVEQEE